MKAINDAQTLHYVLRRKKLSRGEIVTGQVFCNLEMMYIGREGALTDLPNRMWGVFPQHTFIRKIKDYNEIQVRHILNVSAISVSSIVKYYDPKEDLRAFEYYNGIVNNFRGGEK